MFVARINGGFQVRRKNDMGERIIASPVPLDNRLLIRLLPEVPSPDGTAGRLRRGCGP
ncbi:MAG TPA: hypothetical protein VK797_05740 [Tepidisphaeraceae bacterium]|nr:hypothetical protein [Tepidisphaeraceae bacterium]